MTMMMILVVTMPRMVMAVIVSWSSSCITELTAVRTCLLRPFAQTG